MIYISISNENIFCLIQWLTFQDFFFNDNLSSHCIQSCSVLSRVGFSNIKSRLITREAVSHSIRIFEKMFPDSVLGSKLDQSIEHYSAAAFFAGSNSKFIVYNLNINISEPELYSNIENSKYDVKKIDTKQYFGFDIYCFVFNESDIVLTKENIRGFKNFLYIVDCDYLHYIIFDENFEKFLYTGNLKYLENLTPKVFYQK